MTLPEVPPLIVLGMHRSGTSLVARLLSDLGLHMGRRLDIHHEAVAFKNVNRSLLARVGAHWANPGPFLTALGDSDFLEECRRYAIAALAESVESYGMSEISMGWGFKDPRNTLTLPIWRSCFPEAKMLYIYRNGLDVSLSVHRREMRRWVNRSSEKRMFPPTIAAAYRLWALYVEAVQIEKKGDHWLSMRYERLLDSPAEEVARLAGFVGAEPEPQQQRSIIRRLIRRPTRPTRWDSLRLRMLIRAGRLDLRPLRAMGYHPP